MMNITDLKRVVDNHFKGKDIIDWISFNEGTSTCGTWGKGYILAFNYKLLIQTETRCYEFLFCIKNHSGGHGLIRLGNVEYNRRYHEKYNTFHIDACVASYERRNALLTVMSVKTAVAKLYWLERVIRLGLKDDYKGLELINNFLRKENI